MSKSYPVLDKEAFSRWIFPKSDKFPMRKYQKDICERALFSNTLVCLPTGLGKTLIASVVMFNYYKWFPNGILINISLPMFFKVKYYLLLLQGRL